MPATALRSDQVAIVRTPADEAAAVLSGARVAGGFATLFWRVVSGPVIGVLRRMLEAFDYLGAREFQHKVWDSVKKGDGPSYAATQGVGGYPPADDTMSTAIRQSALSLGPLLVLTMLDDSRALTRWLGAALAIGYGAPAIMALLINVVSIPFGVIFALGLLPCGWTLPLAGPYLDLTAEPAPPGTWSVTQLTGHAKGGALSHGNAHDDGAVFRFAAGWLQARLAAVEPITVEE
jgi:hypothetical protein